MEPNRRRKRDHEPHPAPSQTSITSLGDDLLGDILLRLPSLASLSRAALVCARWRHLATSGDFLRRFRAARPSPPLLGCFMSCVNSIYHASMGFHRSKICSDRDVAATIRGGDFLLAGFEDGQQWRIRDCRHGFLLLASQDQFALFNPVSGCRISLSRPTSYYQYDNAFSFHSCFLPDFDGDGEQLPSFRLVSLEGMSGKRQVRAHVYSSDSGEWHSLPWAPPSITAPGPAQTTHDQSAYPSMHAAGRIYWKYPKQKGNMLLSLDTVSMEFSHVALPPVPELYRSQALYAVGDTEDGACCLVCVVKDAYGGGQLQVWRRDEESGTWELEKSLDSGFVYRLRIRQVLHAQVCAVTAGIVLFCTDDGCGRYRYLAFRLKNLIAGHRLMPEADFINGRGLTVYPYLFAWPSS